jgi:hypothetical protein
VSYLFVLASLGGTLWLLDAPGRIWPWFPVGVAAWGAIALAGISTHEGTPAAIQAAVAALIVGGAAYYAGGKFVALGYAGLYWLCLGIVGVHALNVAIRVVLACRPGVDSRMDKGDGSA